MGHDSHQSTASLGCVFVHIWRSHLNEDSPPFGQRGSCDRATVCHLWVHESLRAVIPLLHVLNLNCNGIWVLAWSIPRLPPPPPPPSNAGGSCGHCVFVNTHSQHIPLPKQEAYVPRYWEMFLQEWNWIWARCAFLQRGITVVRTSQTLTHTQGGFLGWLHPSLEFAGKIEPRSDK